MALFPLSSAFRAARQKESPTATEAFTDRGSVDRGSVDPGSVDPGSADPGSVDRGSAKPGSADPGSVDSGSIDPGSADPGAIDPGAFDTASTDTELESVLERLCDGVEQTWPQLGVSRAMCMTHLAQDHDVDSVLVLSAEHASAIVLAHSCALGNERALAAFDRVYLAKIPAMLSHMKLSSSVLDEIGQQVRMKLLVGEGERAPKIAEYASRGKLDGLVQVVATRAAISILRKQKPEVGEEKLLGIADPNYDPGLHYMKQQYRSAFRTCFEAAAKDLSSRDRNLLRLHLLDRVTLETLATMYDVHRATVVRWLARARKELFSETQRRLSAHLNIKSDEFASLMNLIESNLDVSVHRMLATDSGNKE